MEIGASRGETMRIQRDIQDNWRRSMAIRGTWMELGVSFSDARGGSREHSETNMMVIEGQRTDVPVIAEGIARDPRQLRGSSKT